MASSFLSPGSITQEHQLASLYLRRDQSLPVILTTTASAAEDKGYAEGVVTNTRFGSFPHSTLIGTEWGSQVRASQVDTGSRGRKDAGSSKKRKADAISDVSTANGTESPTQPKTAIAANSGFIHVLPPTPESWTTSLPHRTQVVYTPDYSYILHRIRARPGSVLIEAGSGSGSFTHAAARAVFNGYQNKSESSVKSPKPLLGKVFTYEFHAERHRKVKQEMKDHGLADVVHATHRDVYKDGFLLDDGTGLTSPLAGTVFLDLPAPWEALKHLKRERADEGLSALDPSIPIHICTFSPCIEQVQKTISALRQHGWLDIEMVEIQHKRIEVRREYTGLEFEGMRGVNPVAASVDEALAKLRRVEQRAKEYHASSLQANEEEDQPLESDLKPQAPSSGVTKQGKLVHRSEPELKTHTSYLVFAILPRNWSEKDEAEAISKWAKNVEVASNTPKSRRQLKKEQKMARTQS